MRARRIRVVGVIAVFVAASQLPVAAAWSVGRSDEGTTIKHRFVAAHYTTYSLPAEPQGQKPQQSFYVIVDPSSAHGFWFLVFVFPTRVAASSAYDHDLAHLEKLGAAGAYEVVRTSRVVYLGETGPINPGVTLPPTRFAAALAIAEGR